MLKRILILLLVALTAFFVACSDDSDNGTGSNNTDGSMEASVAGSNWEANTAVVAVYESSTGTLNITGQFTNTQTSDSKQMSLTIMQNAAEDAFAVSLFGPAQARYTEASLSNPLGETYIGTSGTVEITELTSSSVKGNFSFSGALNGNGAVKQITDGEFSAKF